MASTIQQRTRELHQERMERRQENRYTLGSGFPKMTKRLATEASNLSSASHLDPNIRNARLHGHNTHVGKGIWSLSSRPPVKQYQPNLTDAYPRDPFTMMPQQPNAPKYYEGKFWSYDYKDSVQHPKAEFNEGRNVVFKPQNIEVIQTKKKYGHNLKGQSSVPLHLCNDTSSELFQRSLQPYGPYEQRDRSHLNTSRSRASEISELKSIVEKYPDATPMRKAKNSTSALNPLSSGFTTERWIETSYPTSSRGRYPNNSVTMGKATVGPHKRVFSPASEPEWYSDFFPKQKVADAMKFMGRSEAAIHKSSTRGKEYDINFHGYK